MTDSQRDKARRVLLDIMLSCMFGDGQEEEMIMEGCNLPGLLNMSDVELMNEYIEFTDGFEEGDDEYELRLQFLSDLEVKKMLGDDEK